VGSTQDGFAVQKCVALNPYVTGGSANTGRIADSNTGVTLANNYARSDMLVNNALVTGGTGANLKDGANIDFATTPNWGTQSWWSNTTSGPGFVFGETGAWDWHETNKLPILRGFPAGTQNPEVP
jgi:hypothetical protein